MNWYHYERVLIGRTPELSVPSTKVTLTVAELMKHLRQAYDSGWQDAEIAREPDVLNPFRDIFGGKAPFA